MTSQRAASRTSRRSATTRGCACVEGKVSECAGLGDLVDRMDGIFHLAAAVGVELVVRSPIRTIQTNLDETEAILAAAGRRRVPVLLASTSEVYGKSLKDEFAEEDDLLIGPPHLGRWSYACSKLMDEFLGLAYARERSVPVVIARIFNTVGPRQTGRYGMVLPRFIAAAKAGRPLRVFGDGGQTRCFCYVGDTVTALGRLLELPGGSRRGRQRRRHRGGQHPSPRGDGDRNLGIAARGGARLLRRGLRARLRRHAAPLPSDREAGPTDRVPARGSARRDHPANGGRSGVVKKRHPCGCLGNPK